MSVRQFMWVLWVYMLDSRLINTVIELVFIDLWTSWSLKCHICIPFFEKFCNWRLICNAKGKMTNTTIISCYRQLSKRAGTKHKMKKKIWHAFNSIFFRQISSSSTHKTTTTETIAIDTDIHVEPWIIAILILIPVPVLLFITALVYHKCKPKRKRTKERTDTEGDILILTFTCEYIVSDIFPVLRSFYFRLKICVYKKQHITLEILIRIEAYNDVREVKQCVIQTQCIFINPGDNHKLH